MTVRVDYTQLDQPTIVLSLAQAPGGWIVWDQACRYYVLSPSPLEFCLWFMKAMADRGDAVIDDASVERATWVGALSEREGHHDAGVGESSSSRRGTDVGLSRSESVPDNVRPIRKAESV